MRKKIVIPEDGVGSGMGFRLSESHGGKEPANPLISDVAFLGSFLVMSVGDGLHWKHTIFHFIFEPEYVL